VASAVVLALLQHCAGPAEAAAPVWIGMSPLALQPQQVELFHLSSQGDRGSRVALVRVCSRSSAQPLHACSASWGYLCRQGAVAFDADEAGSHLHHKAELCVLA
jgi:hypothetical protein